jgi:phospholipase/carboxylesterase
MQRPPVVEKILKSLIPPEPRSNDAIESALFSTSSHNAIYSLFTPMYYEPGYAYPLIVWLHGLGDDERQLKHIMPMLSMRNYAAVAPRGIRHPLGENSLEEGYGWPQSKDDVSEAEQRVFESIEAAAAKIHVSPRKIFLAGFDCGGTMAFSLAMNRPDRFAGVLSLGGAFPKSVPSLGNLLAARRLPIFLAVGRYSANYPPTEVCENLRLLHSAGMSVSLRQYPCRHEIAPQMLLDVNRWIIEQVTSGCSSSAAADQQCFREAD